MVAILWRRGALVDVPCAEQRGASRHCQWCAYWIPYRATVGDGGLKTQVFEYLTDDRRVEVAYVEGLVVRFSVSSK